MTNRPAPTSSTRWIDCYEPRLLFDFDFPRSLCPVEAALPPPRLTLVPLGFLPELRFSPGRLPAAGPDGLRFFFAIIPDLLVAVLLSILFSRSRLPISPI